jgi:hypothetical protein
VAYTLFVDDLPQKSPQHVSASCDEIEAFLKMCCRCLLSRKCGQQLGKRKLCTLDLTEIFDEL